MLKSERSSNNEEAEPQGILSMGHDNLLTFCAAIQDVQLTQDDLQVCFKPVQEFDEQAMMYFGGYILKKLNDFHRQKVCNVCGKYGAKVTVKTEEFPVSQLFIYLKRYDNDKSTLNAPTKDFTSFVQKVCLLTHYFLNKHLSVSGLMHNITDNVYQHVDIPEFCNDEMKQKVCSQIIRTVMNYKLKWQNDCIKEEGLKSKASRRKLKILKHE